MTEVIGSKEFYPDSFHEKYLPGLLQLAPVEVGLTHGVRHDDILMYPDDDRVWLEERGYNESFWAELLDRRRTSHDVRATIITALGDQPRSFLVLKVNLRALDELDGIISPMAGISKRSLEKADWHTPALQHRLEFEDDLTRFAE